jgi:hypothetical protein
MWRTVLAVGSFTVVGIFMAYFAVVVWEWFTETRQLYRKTSRSRYSSRRIMQEAWRTEQETTRIFVRGHERMTAEALQYAWAKRNPGGGVWYSQD